MIRRILLIILSILLGCGYLYFCYRRFKQQKIIEGGIPNNKLRMFWIGICIIIGVVFGGIIYGLSGLFTPSATDTVIISQPTTGTDTQNTESNGMQFVGSGAVLSGGVEDTGEIVSRTTIREKLKHVPVTEKRGAEK